MPQRGVVLVFPYQHDVSTLLICETTAKASTVVLIASLPPACLPGRELPRRDIVIGNYSLR